LGCAFLETPGLESDVIQASIEALLTRERQLVEPKWLLDGRLIIVIEV
jgi:hypothetical protein